MLRRFLLPAAVLALSPALVAHEVTLFPQAGDHSIQVVARYGDPDHYEEIARIKLMTLDAIDPAQHAYSLLDSAQESGDRLSLLAAAPAAANPAGGVWIFASTYDNGFFVHDAGGHAIATTLANYPQARDSAHYFKFSKALLPSGGSSAGYDRVLGHRLELVPRSDPFARDGKQLLLEVRYAGKSLAGAEVEIGDDQTPSRAASQTSDASGLVRIPLDHAGWYRLAVTHRSRSAYPELFQDDDLTASLVFAR